MTSNLPLNIYNPNLNGGNVIQKAESHNSVVPKMVRPFINGVDKNINYVNDLDPNAFRARPLKHWRLQLSSSTGKNSSKLIRIDLINGPGGSNKLVNNNCKTCDYGENGINVIKTENFGSNNINKYNCCNKEKNVIKSAQTIIYPVNEKGFIDDQGTIKYCYNYKQYLQKKCKSFDQRSYHYDPSPAVTKENRYQPKKYKSQCYSNNNNCRISYFKPSNSTFSIQGATSSSNRVQQLKIRTITQNSVSFITAYGARLGNAVANASTYSSNNQSAYTVKQKTNFSCGVLKALFHRSNRGKQVCK